MTAHTSEPDVIPADVSAALVELADAADEFVFAEAPDATDADDDGGALDGALDRLSSAQAKVLDVARRVRADIAPRRGEAVH